MIFRHYETHKMSLQVQFYYLFDVFPPEPECLAELFPLKVVKKKSSFHFDAIMNHEWLLGSTVQFWQCRVDASTLTHTD